jgi:hypothetical protein
MRRQAPEWIEPSETEGDTLQTIGGVSAWGPPAAAGITIQDEGVTVATGVTQLDFHGAQVDAVLGTGEVVVTVSSAPVTTMLVPLVTTNTAGDFDFVWSEAGELIYMEVPL